MKKWTLTILALFYFTLVNTQYFWGNGVLNIIINILLKGLYACLLLFLIISIYKYFKLKFNERYHLVNTAVAAIVLLLTIIWPAGIIDYRIFEKPDILVGSITGAGGCTNLMRFKADGEYVEETICFGKEKNWGKYKIVNDTIHFYEETFFGTDVEKSYFAVLEACDNNILQKCTFTMYMNPTDTVGRCVFGIVKYEL